MIQEIVTDVDLLKKKCKFCFFTDLDILKNKGIIENMMDTAEHHKDQCVGLAAIQIAEYRRIIIVKLDNKWVAMVNPEYTPVKSAGIKKYKEGCLSFPEKMFVNRIIKRRYKKINIKYQLVTGKLIKTSLTKIEAVIVQHLIDLL